MIRNQWLQGLWVFLFPILYLLTWLYRFLFWWDRKRKTSHVLPNSFVISVGNLSVGGTGKTPFTLYLLDLFIENKMSLPMVCLSRGYGSSFSSLGAEVTALLSPLSVGDEPALIKEKHPETTVLIGKNRKSIFQIRFPEPISQVVLLDDGFQHHALKRDLDLVLVDSNKLFSNGFVLPLGFLRESPKALTRAHALIWTRCTEKNHSKRESLSQSLQNQFPHLRIFHAVENFSSPYLADNPSVKMDISSYQGKKGFAFSGIASPESFLQQVQILTNGILDSKLYPDHFSYPEKEWLNLSESIAKYDFAICTEKDFIKIKTYPLPKNLYVLPVQLEIQEKEEFWKFVSSPVLLFAKQSEQGQ